MKRTSNYKYMVVDGKQMSVHRHLMELQLGRKLTEDEVVHHINHIRNDNRIENLQVMEVGDHAKLSMAEYLISNERINRMQYPNKDGAESHGRIRKVFLWKKELNIRALQELKYLGIGVGDKIYCCVEEKDGKKRIIVEGVK